MHEVHGQYINEADVSHLLTLLKDHSNIPTRIMDRFQRRVLRNGSNYSLLADQTIVGLSEVLKDAIISIQDEIDSYQGIHAVSSCVPVLTGVVCIFGGLVCAPQLPHAMLPWCAPIMLPCLTTSLIYANLKHTSEDYYNLLANLDQEWRISRVAAIPLQFFEPPPMPAPPFLTPGTQPPLQAPQAETSNISEVENKHEGKFNLNENKFTVPNIDRKEKKYMGLPPDLYEDKSKFEPADEGSEDEASSLTAPLLKGSLNQPF